MIHFAIVVLVLLVTGCATLPPELDGAVADLRVQEVRLEPARFEGQRVRWGGTIVYVENRADSTLVEMVARELDGTGRPVESDVSQGRFIARFDRFLEPEIYAPGRLLTVTGPLAGTTAGQIGDFPYDFPVVEVTASRLWQPLPMRRGYYDYDPFYSPWRPWPYYAHPWYYP